MVVVAFYMKTNDITELQYAFFDALYLFFFLFSSGKVISSPVPSRKGFQEHAANFSVQSSNSMTSFYPVYQNTRILAACSGD